MSQTARRTIADFGENKNAEINLYVHWPLTVELLANANVKTATRRTNISIGDVAKLNSIDFNISDSLSIDTYCFPPRRLHFAQNTTPK